MNNLELILESYPDSTLMKADGFDDAVIGIDITSQRLIYSYTKCIEILMKSMTGEEAIDYFDYNVRGAYVGPLTPIWMDDDF